MSPNQLYFLDCCRYKIKPSDIINVDDEANTLKEQGYLDESNALTIKAVTVLDEFETFLVKTKKKVATSVLGDNFLEKISEYRNLFPTGELPSGMLARQSTEELKLKFIWFFKTYPSYNWVQVLDATHFYIYKKAKDNHNFMVCSSYFIQKMDIKTKINKSLLADMCQALEEDSSMLNT